ncbi:hypothetical protein PR202_ga18648 [Eleusine coracana subsp. coracana]|uniref:Phospholipase/carboxylesterase/thioesterase domain-containing protein n=1 Tax=Eleusine coracana subsp. coracana TaxID=191504 RepID=A0AAV5CTE4_ELECO|nr:hypothetical protein PR202_ga18648 [Eleusine coracana subsp. coracana]
MSSLARFLFALGAAVAAASLLAASLRRRALPSDLPAQLVPSSHMAGRNRSFILWLHGLGDSGPANEPIRTFFSASEFRLTKWAFPSAPNAPVSCNHGAVMPSWFDIHELPLSAMTVGFSRLWKMCHAMINKEVVDGVHPENIFVCGFSQGGALTLASVLLYPKTLGGGEQCLAGGCLSVHQSSRGFHLKQGRTILFEAGQAGPPFLQSVGVSCEFKAYPDLGHSISKEELQVLESWIKSRLKASQGKDN